MSSMQRAGKTVSIAAGVALGLFVVGSALAAPVHVETNTGQAGGGLSIAKRSDCFVVTPFHVVDFATRITVYDDAGGRASARVVTEFEKEDLAVLQLDSTGGFRCGLDWQDGLDAERRASSVDFLTSIRQRSIQGSDRRRHFFSGREGTTHFRLRPYDPVDKLAEMDSGAVVLAGGSLIAMVVSVDPRTGESVALRQDVIHGLVRSTVLENKRVLYVEPLQVEGRESRVASLGAYRTLESVLDYEVREFRPGDPTRGQATLPHDADYVLRGHVLRVEDRRVENKKYRGRLVDKAVRRAKVKGFLGEVLNEAKEYAKGDRHVMRYTVEAEFTLFHVPTGRTTRHFVRDDFKRDQDESPQSARGRVIELALHRALPQLLAKAGL